MMAIPDQLRAGLLMLTALLVLSTSSIGQSISSKPRLVLEFEKLPNDLTLIKATINGNTDRSFLIDSGLGESLILDKQSANKMKLKDGKGPVLRFEGLGTDVPESDDWKRVSLKSKEGRTITKGDFATIDLENFTGHLNTKVDGIIGVPFFSKYVVRLSYSEKTFLFYEPDKFRYSGTGLILDLLDDGGTGMLIVNGNLTFRNGATLPIRFCIDTGADNEVILHSSIRQSVPNELRKDYSVKNAAVGNPVLDAFYVSIGQIKLGQLSVDAHKALVLESDSSQQQNQVADAQLGAGILKHFTIIIDRPHGHIIFEPITEPPPS